MKECVQHPVYGEIIYDENIWTGKKALTVNGLRANPVSKKEFMIGGKKVALQGNLYTGITLCMEGENIELSPKPKWYEIALAVLPLVFLLTWGNSETLCAVFPVVGGALGGALGGLAGILSLLFMKKSQAFAEKMMIGFCVIVATILVAFALAHMLIIFIA